MKKYLIFSSMLILSFALFYAAQGPIQPPQQTVPHEEGDRSEHNSQSIVLTEDGAMTSPKVRYLHQADGSNETGQFNGSTAIPVQAIPEAFSPALSQIVSEEKLSEDIRAWERHLDALGLVTYYKGEPSYPLFGGEASQSTPNEAYANKTAEELVELAEQNDPDALLALANRAWSAGLWEEGDVYAMEAARNNGSSDPILHGASQRLSQSPLGYADRDGASWFLAAYLQGNMASAVIVEGYFRFLSEEDQYWAVNRAYEIINQTHGGG